MTVISDKANILITNEDFHDLMNENVNLQQQLTASQKECEGLRQENEKYEDKWRAEMLKLMKERDQLKAALEEIVEMTDTDTTLGDHCYGVATEALDKYRALKESSQ